MAVRVGIDLVSVAGVCDALACQGWVVVAEHGPEAGGEPALKEGGSAADA